MKPLAVCLASTAAALVLPAIAVAQTPAAGGDLTRMLNGAPPATQAPRTTSSSTTNPGPTASSAPSTPSGLPPIGGAAPLGAARPVPAPGTPVPAPVATTTTPRPGPATSVATPAPAPAPAPASAPATTAAPAPVATALTPAEVAALPFTVELPTGFRIVQGRQPPNSRVYAIQRGDQPFVRVYVGPESQFPIYSGEQITAGGRTSNVVTEGGQRRAVEHLFRREGGTPADIHVWTSSLEGADRALAERIAQSVDDR